MRWFRVLAVALAATTATAHAGPDAGATDAGHARGLDEPTPAEPSRPPGVVVADHRAASVSVARRAAAIAAAIFPGVVIRGAGSWLVGERRAARRLATTGAIGFAALAIGGLPIAASGSSPYTIWPGVPLVVGGAGVFLSSWFADIWVAAGGAPGPAASRARPPWSLDVATTWQHDAYRERALLGAAGHLELGRIGLDAGGHVDAQRAAWTGELGARWRLVGPDPTGQVVTDGSRVVARAALRVERDDDDRVTLTTGEAVLAGRLDLARVDPVIAGSFAELSIGAGIARTTYPKDRHDRDAILLAGFAWGAYLGDRGELAVFYDHRRDGLVGGIAAGRAAGFVGSVGATAELRVVGPWSVRGQLQIGNAWVSTLGLRYRGGP